MAACRIRVPAWFFGAGEKVKKVLYFIEKICFVGKCSYICNVIGHCEWAHAIDSQTIGKEFFCRLRTY